MKRRRDTNGNGDDTPTKKRKYNLSSSTEVVSLLKEILTSEDRVRYQSLVLKQIKKDPLLTELTLPSGVDNLFENLSTLLSVFFEGKEEELCYNPSDCDCDCHEQEYRYNDCDRCGVTFTVHKYSPVLEIVKKIVTVSKSVSKGVASRILLRLLKRMSKIVEDVLELDPEKSKNAKEYEIVDLFGWENRDSIRSSFFESFEQIAKAILEMKGRGDKIGVKTESETKGVIWQLIEDLKVFKVKPSDVIPECLKAMNLLKE